MEESAFWDKKAGEIINVPKETPELIEDMTITWAFIKSWNTETSVDVTTLVQNIVEIRHSETDNTLARLCTDSPILEDDIYEWLLQNELFKEMQLYRKHIEEQKSMAAHLEAVRILTQLQAYLRYSNAALEDMEKLFNRISGKKANSL